MHRILTTWNVVNIRQIFSKYWKYLTNITEIFIEYSLNINIPRGIFIEYLWPNLTPEPDFVHFLVRFSLQFYVQNVKMLFLLLIFCENTVFGYQKGSKNNFENIFHVLLIRNIIFIRFYVKKFKNNDFRAFFSLTFFWAGFFLFIYFFFFKKIKKKFFYSFF